tara:strand:+ start:544 stop:699 length:156 start_codon:yes stop_codon:yes gene_type:complete
MVIDDFNLYNKVCEEICRGCGTDFEKPGSCEDCMDDESMDHYRCHRYKSAE